jgi:hypothetical protein
LFETVDRLLPKDLTSQDYFPPGGHQHGSTQYGRISTQYRSDCKSYREDNQEQNQIKENFYQEIEKTSSTNVMRERFRNKKNPLFKF